MDQATTKPNTHIFRVIVSEDLATFKVVHRVIVDKDGDVTIVREDDGTLLRRGPKSLAFWWPQEHVAITKAIGIQKFSICQLMDCIKKTADFGNVQTLQVELNSRILLQNKLKNARREVAQRGQNR